MKPTLSEKKDAVDKFKDYWASKSSNSGFTSSDDMLFGINADGFYAMPKKSSFLSYVEITAINDYCNEYIIPYRIIGIRNQANNNSIAIEFDLTS